MKVFRICNEYEVATILSEKSLANVGKYSQINKIANTHNYKKNVKYMHFFQNYLDVFYLDEANICYVCTYDIPEEILNKYEGIGYYLDRDNYTEMESVKEYAVPSNLLDFRYLQQIDKICDTVLFEELLDGSYQEKIITICEKKKIKKLGKRKK